MEPPDLLPAYAELHCLSNFSFQRGASQPEELVERAAALGYAALAITDECSVAGVVRAHVQAKASGLKLLLGAEFWVPLGTDAGEPAHGFTAVVLAHNLQGWGSCASSSRRHGAARPRGTYQRGLGLRAGPGLVGQLCAIARCCWTFHLLSIWKLLTQYPCAQKPFLAQIYGWRHVAPAGARRCRAAAPLTAVSPVHAACRWWRRAMCACMCARASRCTMCSPPCAGPPVAQCGVCAAAQCRGAFAQRARLAALYPPESAGPHAGGGAALQFSLDELRYQYPHGGGAARPHARRRPAPVHLARGPPCATLRRGIAGPPCSSRWSTNWR
jgi:error-prone DNA polymerase